MNLKHVEHPIVLVNIYKCLKIIFLNLKVYPLDEFRRTIIHGLIL